MSEVFRGRQGPSFYCLSQGASEGSVSMRKAPLARKTALKSKVGLKRSKGLKQIRPSVKNAQAKQRKAVQERSQGRCEFFVSVARYWSQDYLEYDSMRCTLPASDLAHIVPRRECAKARDLPEVVIHACRACHRVYDDPLAQSWLRPRVPFLLREVCLRSIDAANPRSPLPASQRKKLT